jgi:hypothetical protein
MTPNRAQLGGSENKQDSANPCVQHLHEQLVICAQQCDGLELHSSGGTRHLGDEPDDTSLKRGLQLTSLQHEGLQQGETDLGQQAYRINREAVKAKRAAASHLIECIRQQLTRGERSLQQVSLLSRDARRAKQEAVKHCLIQDERVARVHWGIRGHMTTLKNDPKKRKDLS